MAHYSKKCAHLSRTLHFIKAHYNFLEKPKILLNGNRLKVPEVAALGDSNRPLNVQICKHSLENLQKNATYLAEQVASKNVIYGVNTGFGGSCDVRTDDVLGLQKSLIRFLNAGFGETMPSYLVRSAMVVRINSLARAYSGARPCIGQLLADMLNNDIIPVIPLRGSISASGDLVPSSYIAACMMGLSDAMVKYKGKLMTAPAALKEANLDPVEFHAKEALSVVNAASFASSLACHVLYNTNIAVVLTQLSTALSIEALRGHLECFHPTIHQCLPHVGQQEVAMNITSMLENSKFAIHINEEVDYKEGVMKQDRYPLRTSPQWLGPALETTLEAIRRVTIEINSANDNPLIDHRNDEILHGGNFQGTSIAVAMDQTRQGIQLCGKLLFGQFQEIINVNMNNGLTPNLAGSDVSIDFGFKGMDLAMASYQSELDFISNNVTNHVLSAELYNQAVNSLALVSARYTMKALEILHMMIANIIYAQLQAIDLRYMKHRVEDALGVLYVEHGIEIIEPVSKAVPWYTFAFTPMRGAEKLFRFINVSEDTQRVFEQELESKMSEVVTEFRNGKHVSEVEELLGTGSRVLYNYIRKTKNVPMNQGQVSPDVHLKIIYESIVNHELSNLLPKIVETHEGLD